MRALAESATLKDPRAKKISSYLSHMRNYEGDLFCTEAVLIYLGIGSALAFKQSAINIRNLVEVYGDKFNEHEIRKINSIVDKLHKLNAFGVPQSKAPITLPQLDSIADERTKALMLTAFVAGCRKTEALQLTACHDEMQAKPCAHLTREVVNDKVTFLFNFSLARVKRRGILHTRVRCVCDQDKKFCLCTYWDEHISKVKMGDINVEFFLKGLKKSNPLFQFMDIATHSLRSGLAMQLFAYFSSRRPQTVEFSLVANSMLLIQYHLRWSSQDSLVHYVRSMPRYAAAFLPICYIGAVAIAGEEPTTLIQNCDSQKIVDKCKAEILTIMNAKSTEQDEIRKVETLELAKAFKLDKEERDQFAKVVQQIESIKGEIKALTTRQQEDSFDTAILVQCSFCNQHRLVIGSQGVQLEALEARIGDFPVSCLGLGADCAQECDFYRERERKKPREVNWSAIAKELKTTVDYIFQQINTESNG